MAQNRVIKGLDNPVVINLTSALGDFGVAGLSTFSEIELTIGDETYSTVDNPTQLFLNGNSQLRLKIGDSTALDEGCYTPEIVGFSTNYNDGYLLTGAKKPILGTIQVV